MESPISHTDLRLAAKLPMEMVEKSTDGQCQGCSTEVCPKVFHKEVEMQLNLWSQMGLDYVLGREPVVEHCIIPSKVDDRDPWEKHGNHFVHTYVSTKPGAISPFCASVYLWFISCNSNLQSSKPRLFWDVLLPDLTLCSLCFICLNLLTENKDVIVHQWYICSRELLQVIASTRCFLKKHPQHSEHPQWMFKCINCKKYHHIFIKKALFACFVIVLP